MKLGDIPFDGLFYIYVRRPDKRVTREVFGFSPDDVPAKYKDSEVVRLYPVDDAIIVEVNETEDDKNHKDSLEFIVKSWVYNLDVEPYQIDLETAKEYATCITPGTCSDAVTPERLMNLWNRIAKE